MNPLTLFRSLVLLILLASACALCPETAFAQAEGGEAGGEITLETDAPSDAAIAQRIATIFGEIDTLSGVEISVESGVVTLTGETLTADAASRAEALALRVEGVVTVENRIDRDLSVSTRVAPAMGELETTLQDLVRIIPLLALAMAVFLVLGGVGWLLSRWDGLWRLLAPNSFVADLLGSTVFSLFVVFGLVSALTLLDSTAFLGALLGAAGVIGLAVGFAVKDTIENYIASIMLSVRQPFRPNDHVVIDGQEGRVIRLTSRATVLMTLEGNHLRLPNALVFKAVILNYTRNPERRFDFTLGVDPEDDPLSALETGLEALKTLSFVMAEPDPAAGIREVGDSTINLIFSAWIDQTDADFLKSRSVAIATVKAALDEAGFTLPDPTYRLRIDSGVLPTAAAKPKPEPDTDRAPVRPAKTPSAEITDVAPDTSLAERVEEERREAKSGDLLSEDAPSE
ncbi:mechanosensitive ion channel family protein [Oceanicaulis alexandrii]|uniref:mechanosensitive ion channel family protein n=1 Tax=Oceanicaulis alexandrii TaxID=153233 RepID=UPI0003B793A9|nr:mechanosensitive ion channel family protein [Oceanicaulis alexandrii]